MLVLALVLLCYCWCRCYGVGVGFGFSDVGVWCLVLGVRCCDVDCVGDVG